MIIPDFGKLILWILLAVAGVIVQWWLIVFAVRRAMQDHTIWQHTKWPELKNKIDGGEVDEKGFPIA